MYFLAKRLYPAIEKTKAMSYRRSEATEISQLYNEFSKEISRFARNDKMPIKNVYLFCKFIPKL